MAIQDEYFEWLFQLVSGKRYRDLLRYLYETEFYAVMEMDENRKSDGIDLRYRFASDVGIPDNIIDTKFDRRLCSVLEVMVALAVRMEEQILGDPEYGDRTSIWFWEMIKSLGLYDMRDDKYDEVKVHRRIKDFLDREFDSNGRNSLFTVRNSDLDMRNVEIWYQMCMYADNILSLR